VFGRYYDQHGLPQALYADLDSIYRVNAPAALVAQPPPLTQFGWAMNQLGVRIVPAYSPQAKGRVERRHGLFQDRLVKELRLAGIQTLAAANRYLPRKHSGLEEVLCWEAERVVARDWTLSWEGRSYQIERRHAALSLVGRRVVMRELLDGRRQVLYQGQKLHWRELPVESAPLVSPPAEREIPATLSPLGHCGGAAHASRRSVRARHRPRFAQGRLAFERGW